MNYTFTTFRRGSHPSDERGDDAQVDRDGRAVAGGPAVRARASIKGKPAPINYCIVVAGHGARALPVVGQSFVLRLTR